MKKRHRVGEDEEVEEEVTDLISQVQTEVIVQLASRMRDMGSATYCALFLPRNSAVVTEMQSAGRADNELVTRDPTVEGASPHIWFFTAMLKGMEKTLANKDGEMILQDPGKAGSGGDAQEDSRRPEAARDACLGESVQAPPDFRKPWSTTQVTKSLRCGRIHLLQMEAGGAHPCLWRRCWASREAHHTNGG